MFLSKIARPRAESTANPGAGQWQDFAKAPLTGLGVRAGAAWNGALTATTQPGLALQRKLAIGRSDDPLEHEADRIANQVLRTSPGSRRTSTPAQTSPIASAPALRRTCACGGTCDECTHDALQRKLDGRDSLDAAEAPAAVHQTLRSPGQPLEGGTRTFFESRFGRDFSTVRVHTDPQAAESAGTVHARAYTVGNHIVFAPGTYRPATTDGRLLLAHELAHTLQQSRSVASSQNSQPTHLSTTAPALVQRQKSAGHPAAKTPALGKCHPVQDDLKPTAPWAQLQKAYQSRCDKAAKDVEGQAEHALSDLWHGRMPTTPHLPDARSSVDCACANLPPRAAAIAAMPVVLAAGPLAARLFWHFLDASGTSTTIDVAGMIASSAGVRAKIRQSMAKGGTSGTTRLEQSDYGDRELQFAYGAIDCVQWQVIAPAGPSWQSNPATQIRISMLDYYEFHPGRTGVSQCAHAACVESVARGEAKNFWTSGDSSVSWGDLKKP